jgi:basic amino acid/polyamine antiporter, APA family
MAAENEELEDLDLVKDEPPRLVRALGPVEGMAIVVGTVIGSGIFYTPAEIARNIGGWGFGVILLAWVIGALLSLAGALAYAEMGAMFPRSGGQYVFIREAFGSLWGFLFGWMEFWVARSGSIAVLTVAFAMAAGTFGQAVGWIQNPGDWGVRWTAFLGIFLLTMANYVGVRVSGTVQVIFTGIKVAAIAALVICAFALPGGKPSNWEPWVTDGGASGGLFLGALGTAMVGVLWSYDGWANGAAVSEEVHNPQRNVPRALVWGTLAVAAVYLSANLAYHYVLPTSLLRGIAGEGIENSAAARVANVLFDQHGVALISLAVMISTLGAANGSLLTGTRIFFAMSRDGVFFHDMARLHPTFRTPDRAILLQGLWAGVLVLVPFKEMIESGLGWNLKKALYYEIIDYVMFGSWIFYGMAVAALFALRRKFPDAERPYRAWGYPVVPFLFLVVAVAFVAHILFHNRTESLRGIVIMALGLPAYWWWRKHQPPQDPAAESAS